MTECSTIAAGPRANCPRCKERMEADTSRCYCEELNRRVAYDAERARRGLAALYRPPTMR
jgi:hypothetical protein